MARSVSPANTGTYDIRLGRSSVLCPAVNAVEQDHHPDDPRPAQPYRVRTVSTNPPIVAIRGRDVTSAALTFAFTELPRLDAACRDGQLPLTGLLRHVRSFVSTVRHAAADAVAADRPAFGRAIARVDSSVVFHSRVRGLDPDWVRNLVPGLSKLLDAAPPPADDLID